VRVIFFGDLGADAATCIFFEGLGTTDVEVDVGGFEAAGFDDGGLDADAVDAGGLDAEVCAAAGDDPAKHMETNISAKRKKLRRTTTTLIIAENCYPGERRCLLRDCESVPD
jgi:hypothetical protein